MKNEISDLDYWRSPDYQLDQWMRSYQYQAQQLKKAIQANWALQNEIAALEREIRQLKNIPEPVQTADYSRAMQRDKIAV